MLFCAGAATLSAVAKQRERFAQACDFLIPTPEALDALNDKEAVHRRCRELGIPVPRSFDGEPDCYPVIIKPHCGEKFGLKAQDRYAQANNAQDYEVYRLLMSRYDPSPIVQEKVDQHLAKAQKDWAAGPGGAAHFRHLPPPHPGVPRLRRAVHLLRELL